MASKLRRIIPMIEYLVSLNSGARKKFIKGANAAVIKSLVDLFYNVNIGSIGLESATIDKLRPYKKNIKAVCAPKKSLAKRRLELVQGDRIFGKVVPLLLPELIRYIVPKLDPKKEPENHGDADRTTSREVTENVASQ